MWGLEQGLRLWVCQQPVSMRYGIRGLTQMVWSWKGHSPASGDVYVFFSKDRKTMKALKWDGDGFLMYTKRLSQVRFREVLKKGDDSVRRLQWDVFYMGFPRLRCKVNSHNAHQEHFGFLINGRVARYMVRQRLKQQDIIQPDAKETHHPGPGVGFTHH